MAVEVSYSTAVDGLSKDEATTLLGELIELHGKENSSSGTYELEHSNYVAEHQRIVFELTLRDADEEDFPTCRDDLVTQVADLGVDLGSEEDVAEDVSGNIL